jgi:hypothetical protein
MLTPNELTKELLSDIYFSALVVENNDPKQKGRIKIRIDGLHSDVPNGDLPWALPLINLSVLDIPQKNKNVWVQFQQGKESEPVYLGYILKTNMYNGTVLAEDYPDTRGFYDGTNWITINYKTGKIEIHNATSQIVLNDSGITINSDAELNITVNSQCNITSSASINLSAPIINCN